VRHYAQRTIEAVERHVADTETEAHLKRLKEIIRAAGAKGITKSEITRALDLGTTTGWALRGHDGLITSGTVSLQARPLRRRRHALPALHQLADRDRPAVRARSPRSGSRRSAATRAPTRPHVYGGLMATLTAWAELRGVPYEGVPVGTIKRHATGKGNARRRP
jgi:hypothetical protein